MGDGREVVFNSDSSTSVSRTLLHSAVSLGNSSAIALPLDLTLAETSLGREKSNYPES